MQADVSRLNNGSFQEVGSWEKSHEASFWNEAFFLSLVWASKGIQAKTYEAALKPPQRFSSGQMINP